MPNADTRKPPPKQSAAVNIDLRGPTLSTQRPNSAADEPRTTIAMEKIQPTCFRSQSPGAECVIPSSLVSGRLKVENAYACPIERCTARAAGGTKNRLNPGGATVFSRSRKDVMGSPALFVVRGNPELICIVPLALSLARDRGSSARSARRDLGRRERC